MVNRVKGSCFFEIVRDGKVISTFTEDNDLTEWANANWIKEIVKFTATGQRNVNTYRPTHVELLVDSVGDINPYSAGTGSVTEDSIKSFDE